MEYYQYWLKSWDFEGSNDGTNWSLIKTYTNDNTFTGGGQSHTFTINEGNEYYQHFRIKITGPNSMGDHYMMCSGFEIYGYLTGNK